MIRINGKPRDQLPGRLLDLLAVEGIEPGRPGFAIAVNGAVVPRARWAETVVNDGDEVEIVRIMQGG